MNRNGYFELHLQERGFRKAEDHENPQVKHWDTYKTRPLDAQFVDWPRSCTNALDNQWTYYQRIFDHGLAEFFPETEFNWCVALHNWSILTRLSCPPDVCTVCGQA